MTDFEDLQNIVTKEEIINEFFTWLFNDEDVKDKSVVLKSEIDLSLAHDYFDPKIYFPEQIYRFFQTPAMRRLGRISQLSLSVNEFPNTYHDRLEHSKGVYNRKLEEMIYNFKSAKWRQYIENYNLKIYLIAELIKIAGHDIGHFPFSHAMEEQLCDCHGAHEIIGQKIMLENKEIQDVLLSISPKLPNILKSLYEHDFLNFRLHDEGSFDVDRLDYMSRDSMYIGSPVNLKTLPYTSIPYFSHTEPFTDVYSYYSLSDIESLLNLREYRYDTLYMSENEQASECIMNVFFKQFLSSNSNCGNNLRRFLTSFNSSRLDNISIEEFIKWDDIAIYKELLDIAQHHENENIRKLATLIIPRIDTFLNILYSMLGCKKGEYSKEDTEFLAQLKAIISGNSELIADLSNPNFMSENMISLKPSPLLERLKKSAEDAYQKIQKDKDYPHPINMPVGLFDYLENGRLETAYTRTLAYLLDAKAPHGYGDKILRNLLAHYKINYEKLDYSVYPEYCFKRYRKKFKRFDVFIQGTADKKPFVVVIEAKTVSTEGKQQLASYDEYLKKNFADKGVNVIKIYLTINEDTPSQAFWRTLSWLDIIQILMPCIKENKDKFGYDFIRYYISSIYSQLYGHEADYLNVYQLLEDSILQEYANDVANEDFSLNIFKQNPSAFSILYQYTPPECKFDESYKNCTKQIKEEISQMFGNSEIHEPQTWNRYITLKKHEYLNIGITNRVSVRENTVEDELWWYANINFASLEQKMKNIEKYKAMGIKEEYKNSDINASGHNIIFFMQKYENAHLPNIKLDNILKMLKKK